MSCDPEMMSNPELVGDPCLMSDPCLIGIEGLEWMRRDRSTMPLLDHAHLRVEKPVIDEIMLECFSEPFTGKLSTAVVEPEPEKEDYPEDLKDESDDDTEEMTIPFSVLGSKGEARELLVDPVYHGWRRALRIVGFLQSWVRIHKHKTHNGIQLDCKICMLGSSLWDPLTDVKKDYFFRWETDRIKLDVKSEIVSRYLEQQGILYEDGRLGVEVQFESQDLDQEE